MLKILMPPRHTAGFMKQIPAIWFSNLINKGQEPQRCRGDAGTLTIGPPQGKGAFINCPQGNVSTPDHTGL